MIRYLHDVQTYYPLSPFKLQSAKLIKPVWTSVFYIM